VVSHCHCEATDRHFTPARARDELETYRRKGPTGTARLIIQELDKLGLSAERMLDIGAGIGVLHHELLDRGVVSAIHIEAAAAYVDAGREEASKRGHEGRVIFRQGDVVELADELADADLVTLDRVVCCYPDLAPLMHVSARKARRCLALSFPHDRWYVRAHTWWQNRRRRRAASSFRTFVHPVKEIQALVRTAGFAVRRSRKTLIWEVLVCIRQS
jgi:hypothetical protein